MEEVSVLKMLDEKYGKDNWKIRKISKNAKGEPSLTISSTDLKKIGVDVGDRILMVIDDGKLIIQKLG